MMNKKRIGLNIPLELYNVLKEEAIYTGYTLNSLILQILWDWIENKREG